MASKALTGYDRVAVINQCGKDYFFALYDDGNDYYWGDLVTVSGDNTVKEINDIISVEEAKERCTKNIISEVTGKVIMGDYYERVEKRKKITELKKKMDAQIKKVDEAEKYKFYADKNPELSALFKEYKELIG